MLQTTRISSKLLKTKFMLFSCIQLYLNHAWRGWNLLVRPLMTKFICDHQMSNGTWYPKTPHTHEFGPSLKGRRPCLCLITHGYQLVPLYSSLEHSKQTEFTNVLLTRCLDWSMLVLSRTLSCFHHVLTASDYNHPTRFDNTK